MLRLLLIATILFSCLPVLAHPGPKPKPVPAPYGPPAPKPSKPTPKKPSPKSPPKPKPIPKSQPKKLPTVRHHWEIMPKKMVRPTKHILFLFDSSGSMDEDRIATAIEFVLNRKTGIAAAPFDDFHIALATFGSGVARWEGTKDVDPNTKRLLSKYGWSAMPSADNLKAARKWISSNLDKGSTYFIPGIRHCFTSNSGTNAHLADLKQAVTVDELTILIITDGAFTEPDKACSDAIKKLQKSRRDKKLAEALIGFVGIDVRTPKKSDEKPRGGHATLLKLAKKHAQLGYLRIEFVSEDEDN